ncbi:contact-dependent growth inhibition system immunity protein [Burkholderia sp. IMCC1007]|uniref:contact-dependent growth inhibition system immunity protein n=1 Tax=Burkholderia sp. IMCC1007 TaxID=3004104 RepID=UPI003FA471BB
MSDVKPWRGAAIYRNRDFIFIGTQSGYGVSIADPDGGAYFLDTDADDETLGRCLNDALLKKSFHYPTATCGKSAFLRLSAGWREL